MVYLSKMVEELVGLLSIEQYGVRGVLSGERLLIAGLREGNLNAYMYDGSKLTKLNKAPINGVAWAKYDASKVIIYRDIASGRERVLMYTVDPDKPGEEKPLSGVKPARLLGVAYDEEKVVFSSADMKGSYIFVHSDGKTEKVLTYPGFPIVSDVKGDLAVGIDLFGQSSGRYSLFYLDLGTREVNRHVDSEGSAISSLFSPSGSIIYAVEMKEGAELKELDPDTGKTSKLKLPYKDLEKFNPMSFNWLGLTRDGKLVAVARKEGRSEIFLDGMRVEAPLGLHGSVVEWKGNLVASHASLNIPSRIVRLPRGTVLSGPIPEYVSSALGRAYFVKVKSFDGEVVPTYILESNKATKPGPTVVLVHGGPFSEYANAWHIFAVSMALLGFHVVMPNYRGSTGYGEKWRLRIVGDPCGGELEDITKAAEWAKESGLTSRLYIVGYSYGGYMVMCSLTRKPGLYRAGVAGASVVDWEMMYEMSDAALKKFIELISNNKRELRKERSPIAYVDGLSDPLCIIHPQNDTRTPLKPVLKFMELASEKGKGFEAHIAPDMGPSSSKADNLIKILLPAALFLARMEGKVE